MSSLAYMGAGLGQGLMQGKQFQIQRQNTQFEQGLKNRQLAEETASRQQQAGIAQHAQNMQSLDKLNGIVQDPNFKQNYSPGIQAGFIRDRMGFLRQHPELDFGHEVAAADSQVAAVNRSADAESAASLQPSGMNPSVSGQTPTPPSQAPPAAAPAQAPPNGVAGPVQPQAPNDNSNPHPYGDQQTNSLDGNTAPVGLAGAPDAASNSYLSDADYYHQKSLDTSLPQFLQDEYRQKAEAARTAGMAAGKTGAETGLLTTQTASGQAALPYAGETARAQMKAVEQGTETSKAQAGNLAANTREIPANSAASRAAAYAGAKQSTAEAGAIPQRVGIEQQQVDLTKAGQDITRAQNITDKALRTRTLDQAMKQFGFTQTQFETTKKGLLAQYAHSKAEADKMIQDPSFNSQAAIKTITDNAFVTDRQGEKHPGPTYGAYQKYMQAVQNGTAPTLYNDTMGSILGKGQATGGQGFDVKGLMADKTLTPAQKDEVIRRARASGQMGR